MVHLLLVIYSMSTQEPLVRLWLRRYSWCDANWKDGKSKCHWDKILNSTLLQMAVPVYVHGNVVGYFGLKVLYCS